VGLGFHDLFLLDFFVFLHVLDIVDVLDGAEVVDHAFGVVGDGLDVVRP